MIALRPVLLISLMTFTVACQQKSPPQTYVRPASCLTVPPANPFKPPAPYELEEGGKNTSFWLGTDKLWTALLKSGEVWGWVPHEPGHEQDLTAKTFWGSVDYDPHKEGNPDLKVSGRRVDGSAPRLLAHRATNVIVDDLHSIMLAGVYVPAPGCWEITGEYKGQKLSYVVWVKPVEQDKQ